MTDDKRELAEWVARWAGWESRRTEESYWYDDEGMPVDFETILTDEALAWRALVEYVTAHDGRLQRTKSPDGFLCMHFSNKLCRWRDMEDEDAKRCVFRALRAAKES